MAKTIWLSVWFVGWMVTWPALHARFEENTYTGGREMQCDTLWRENLGMSMLFAAFPPAWIATPFITGFWSGGFDWAVVPPHYCGERP